MIEEIAKPGSFIKEVKEKLKNEDENLFTIFESHCNQLRKREDVKNYINNTMREGKTIDVFSSLVCCYASFVNEARNRKTENLIDEERIRDFVNELRAYMVPENLREPYHSVAGVPPLYEGLKKNALLLDACNNLAHAFENDRDAYMTLMNTKMRLLSVFMNKCLLEKSLRPQAQMTVGYARDEKAKRDVIVAEIPFVGMISWHLSEKHGAEFMKERVNAFFSKEEVKQKYQIENPIELAEYKGERIIDPKHNSARLLNDVRFMGPDKLISKKERELRKYLHWVPGGFDENKRKMYRLENTFKREKEK